MSKIKTGDRVKFRRDNRLYIGIVPGTIPANQEPEISTVCDCSLDQLINTHQIHFPINLSEGKERLFSCQYKSCLVSVRADKYCARPRSLYHARWVVLCADDDERDGVYPVEQGERKWAALT